MSPRLLRVTADVPGRTMASALLGGLAQEHRGVVSAWRALVQIRRATDALEEVERRWSKFPQTESDLTPVLRQMERRGDLAKIPGTTRLYRITAPFAQQRPLSEEEILLELNPYATVSHLSALVFHGLTNQLPNSFTMLTANPRPDGVIPLDTESDDWVTLALPPARIPTKLLKHKVTWTKTSPYKFFGYETYRPQGFPIRVTTPERTLLDGLLEPVLCGGMLNILTAWRNARYTLSTDLVVQYAERFNVAVLLQRVGYILEALGLHHEALDYWQTMAKRGGSSKLVGADSYEPVFNARWNLSLNGPVHALQGESSSH